MPAVTHARQQIREAVATALTGLTTTSTRVYQSRMRPASDSMVPCLLITCDSEQIEQTVQSRQYRLMTLIVQGIAKGTTTLDDTLDTIAAEVETALQAAGSLGGKVPGGLVLQRHQVEFDDSLDKPVGVIVMEFSAGYFTTAGSPGSFL
jgi:hypothetical protein